MFTWSHRGRYPDPREYDSEVYEWRKRKRLAKAQGESFDEPMPEPPKKMMSRPLPMICALLFACFEFWYIGWFADLMCPYHMPYEYRGEIAKLKDINDSGYYFFPEDIPKGAEDIKWIRFGFLRNMTNMLVFTSDREYIDGVVDKYGGDAEVYSPHERSGGYFGLYNRENGRADKIKIYVLHESGMLDYYSYYGFFVDEEINRIGFFAEM